MSSAINASFPVEGAPTTSSVRDNFAAAKSEIETLQAGLTTEIADRVADVNAEEGTRIAQDAILQAAITALGSPIYETSGTWTPVITATTPGDWANTWTNQVGFWQRHGNRIFFDCIAFASASNHTTASGQIIVTGLPVAAKNVTNHFSIHACEWDGLTIAGTFAILGRVQPNTSHIQFILSNGAGTSRAIAVGDHTSTQKLLLYCSGSYEV